MTIKSERPGSMTGQEPMQHNHMNVCHEDADVKRMVENIKVEPSDVYRPVVDQEMKPGHKSIMSEHRSATPDHPTTLTNCTPAVIPSSANPSRLPEGSLPPSQPQEGSLPLLQPLESSLHRSQPQEGSLPPVFDPPSHGGSAPYQGHSLHRIGDQMLPTPPRPLDQPTFLPPSHLPPMLHYGSGPSVPLRPVFQLPPVFPPGSLPPGYLPPPGYPGTPTNPHVPPGFPLPPGYMPMPPAHTSNTPYFMSPAGQQTALPYPQTTSPHPANPSRPPSTPIQAPSPYATERSGSPIPSALPPHIVDEVKPATPTSKKKSRPKKLAIKDDTDSDSQSDTSSTPSGGKKQFACSICDYVTTRHFNLKRHFRTHNAGELPSDRPTSPLVATGGNFWL